MKPKNKNKKLDDSPGTCASCKAAFTKTEMPNHLASCAARPTGKNKVFHLVVEDRHRPEYWTHIEIDTRATVDDLDAFLRYTWLDCCEHLSSFDFGEQLEGSPIAAKFADVEYEDEAEEIVLDA